MKPRNALALTAVAVGLTGVILYARRADAGAENLPPCELASLLIQRASVHQARAEFLLNASKIVNDPSCNPTACLAIARSRRDDAIALAQDQFDLRVELCGDLGHEPYDPQIAPSEFSTTIDNTYFPLSPGTTLVYERQTPDGLEHDEFNILGETATIGGFTVRTIHDVVTIDGEPHEDTIDWFAQRANGDVWYFGEIAKNFEDGLLDNLNGSWRTGKNGAKPGILMLATPHIGDVYRQEFSPTVAEDIAEVIAFEQTVTVPAGTFRHCLETEESTPISPNDVTFKFYAPGIGTVLEVDEGTGERVELVEIRH